VVTAARRLPLADAVLVAMVVLALAPLLGADDVCYGCDLLGTGMFVFTVEVEAWWFCY